MILPGGKEISTKLALGIGGGVIAVAGIATAVILSINGQDAFRSITVLDTVGQVTVTRDSEQMEPYRDMKLESGDDIQVGDASELDMVLDTDKTVYVEENTHMWLEALGDANNSTTVIYMDAGATMHKIDNKLSDESTYQVDTPNSTMSIRGTLPRVEVTERDGQIYTDYQVFEGNITIQLKTTEGELIGEPIEVGAGYQIETRGDESISEVVLQEMDGKPVEMKPIDYKDIPSAALEHLEEIAVSGDKVLSVGERPLQIEELHGIIEEVKAEEARLDAESKDEGEAEPEPEEASEAEVTPDVKEETAEDAEAVVTPAITPKAKVLAEPVAAANEGIITPAVTPEVTPVASTPSEEASGSEGTSSGSSADPATTPAITPTAEYTVTFVDRSGVIFCTQTVTAGERWKTPILQPYYSPPGSWPAPQVVTGDVTVRFGE